jgi:hypothetical protein
MSLYVTNIKVDEWLRIVIMGSIMHPWHIFRTSLSVKLALSFYVLSLSLKDWIENILLEKI